MINAQDVALCLLDKANSKFGNPINNFMLQRLLYYCQGYYLAYSDKPLFKEKIHRSEFGPIVKKIFNQYKKFEGKNIILKTYPFKNIDEEMKKFIYGIFSFYGGLPASQIRRFHALEGGCLDTKIGEVIPIEKIRENFVMKVKPIYRKPPFTIKG